MEHLLIEQTVSTLGVDFDPLSSVLSMRGESYPENAPSFFSPILSWLENYLESLEDGTEVLVDLDIIYFNSSSSKVMMNIFDLLDDAARKGVGVRIVWRYHLENEISEECGREFAEELTAAGFEMKPYGDEQ